MSQYYDYCVKPNPSAGKYWTQKLKWGQWKRHYKQSAYNQDIAKFNQCLRQSKYGRSEINMGIDCDINQATGKMDCKVNTGKAYTNANDVAGVGQLGLSDDVGKGFMGFTQQQLMIGGAAIMLLLVAR